MDFRQPSAVVMAYGVTSAGKTFTMQVGRLAAAANPAETAVGLKHCRGSCDPKDGRSLCVSMHIGMLGHPSNERQLQLPCTIACALQRLNMFFLTAGHCGQAWHRAAGPQGHLSVHQQRGPQRAQGQPVSLRGRHIEQS